jgi:hypothetical protein
MMIKSNIVSRTSEILLVAVLFVIVGLVRVYFAGSDGFMVVWKGEFGYKDTFVNLADFYKMPKQVAALEHAHVLGQLEEMGLASPDH